MKKIIYSLLVILAVSFVSCDDSSEDHSKITYFIDLELEGDEVLAWKKGIPYEEPGYIAISGDEDLSSEVVVTGTADINNIGVYKLSYSIANEDGFANTKVRTVVVCDPTPSELESGAYIVSKDSYRDYNGQTAYNRDFPIIIYQVEPGVFYTSDFMGGWYDQRAGYGPDYAMVGHFELNADNTLNPVDSYVVGWGDSMEGMTGEYNTSTQTIVWDVEYTDSPFIFHVIMTKK